MSVPETSNQTAVIQGLGQFEGTLISFDWGEEIEPIINSIDSKQWVYYNSFKPGFNRYGLSLKSLNGEIDGQADLTSIYEYNKINGTDYNEMSYSTSTPYWEKFSPITDHFKEIESEIGRSHILKLDKGGFFPPHRDLDNSIRLIAFLNVYPGDIYFTIGNQVVTFDTSRLYLADTKKVHSLFSFVDGALILVLNLKPSMKTLKFIVERLVYR